MKLFLIAFGGAAGALLRYAIAGFIYSRTGEDFPWGTLVVNLTGAFLIGFLWQLFERILVTPNTRTFLFVGVLGAYTTFSTYGLETAALFREGESYLALWNILASNTLGLAAVFLGLITARQLLTWLP
jgi:CrcB protein